MRITSKGQVTIPQSIRKQAGLNPSCEVMFRLVDGQVLLEKVDPSGQQRGAEALALLRARPSRSRLSTDAILALARGTAEGDAAV